MHVATISRNLAKAFHCLNNESQKVIQITELDNSLYHTTLTEEKSRNYSITFNLKNMQWQRVEYLVLWSFSHTCTLAQEQPGSDYICVGYPYSKVQIYLCPSLTFSIPLKLTLLPEISVLLFTTRNLLFNKLYKWYFHFYYDTTHCIFATSQANILLNSQNHFMSSTSAC